jgi:hypothetical protein
MEHLLIRMPFGSLAIGDTAGENGFGSLAIGRDPQDLMRFGSLGTGNREKEGGSGTEDIGKTGNSPLPFPLGDYVVMAG